jgi:segregation and condensation protein B
VNGEKRRPSLADEAANWVPPWRRDRAEAAPPAEAEPSAEAEPEGPAEPAGQAEPEGEAEPERAAGPAAQVEPVGEAEPQLDSEPVLVPEVTAGSAMGAGAEAPAPAEPPAGEPAARAGEPVAEIRPEAMSGTEPRLGAQAEATSGVEAGPGVEPGVEALASTPEAGAPAAAPAEPVPSPQPGSAALPPEPAAAEPGGSQPAEVAADGQPLDPARLRGAIEAILLVLDEPTSEVVLAQALGEPTERVAEVLAALAEEYTRDGRGFELRRAAGGWRLYTRPEFASYVERFVLDGQQVRLTQAALETLAVVAYKQPVTRSRISAIRGVNCDGVVRSLVSRGLIEECGTEPETGAHLYRTTPLFLEKLGLDSVEQLPPLAPFLPEDVDEIADAEHR